jgi:cytochrome c oxidase cbb3-type subunit 4
MEGYTYEQVLSFAQSWGAVYFMLLFAAVCTYALWPANKKKFDEAARIPLEEDEAAS